MFIRHKNFTWSLILWFYSLCQNHKINCDTLNIVPVQYRNVEAVKGKNSFISTSQHFIINKRLKILEHNIASACLITQLFSILLKLKNQKVVRLLPHLLHHLLCPRKEISKSRCCPQVYQAVAFFSEKHLIMSSRELVEANQYSIKV